MTEEGVVVIGAVDDKTVHCSALSGKTDVARANVASHAGSQQDEVDEVAPVNRQVRDCAVVHRGTDLCSSNLDQGHVFSNGNRLRRSGNHKLNVHGHGLSDSQFHAFPLKSAEARPLGGNIVVADKQQRSAEESVIVGQEHTNNSCFHVLEINVHVRQYCAGLV